MASFSEGKSSINRLCHFHLGDGMFNRLCDGDMAFKYKRRRNQILQW